MDLQAVREEVRPLIPLKSGGSFKLMWELFYTTRLLKYSTPQHLKSTKHTFSKICSKAKLHALCEMGYLENPDGDVFIATNKVMPVIKQVGYITKLLPDKPKGKGGINELKNTDVFVDCLKHPLYKALLFPRFPLEKPYIVPDALLVLAKDNKYKLMFLEIESEKPKWKNYLERKKENYKRLAQDSKVFSYWMTTAPLLDLKIPDKNRFCFCVACIGKIKADWSGWIFGETIYEHENK